ncbi:hypothetical protein J3A83DRAFT_4368016 [Scleroderma citrinum]
MALQLDTIPDTLPDDIHRQLDEAVNADIDVRRIDDWPPKPFDRADLGVLLSSIVEYSGGRLNPKYDKGGLANVLELLRVLPQLGVLLQDAWEIRSYRAVRNVAVLQDVDEDRIPFNQGSLGVDSLVLSQAAEAWLHEYRGNYHEVMLKNINSMKRHAEYDSSVAIIQSSGAGKSRMVDEQAKLVFTIPFNLRDPEERFTGAYPLEDTEVRSYLCSTSKVKSVPHGTARAALFFGHLFSEVTSEVKRVFRALEAKLSPGVLARRWRTHLSQKFMRSQLYTRVIEACENDKARLDKDFSWILAGPGTNLKELLMVLDTVCDFPKLKDVKVMLYFDEAQELHHAIPDNEQGKTLYDIMWSSLVHFKSPSVFTIFLTTQPSVTLLAPFPKMATSALLSIRRALQAPITETPFDCHPDLPLRLGQLKLEDLGELPFLARFGRPLFWAMIEAAEECETVMRLARTKLVHDDNFLKMRHSDMAMLAVLDVLITIDYDPRRDSARKAELEMVANHMRTALSAPDHRLYICSGYPSEPFLAEAASRQMHHYQEYGCLKNRGLLSLLTTTVNHGLIDPTRKSEMVMRVLLRQAYMDAIIAEQDSKAQAENFSEGCGFLQFLKALFSDSLHTSILKSEPDNKVKSRCALEDAFGHAVVRFTHFVKVVNDAIVNTGGMISGFLRGAAFIRCNCQKGIDIVIPILLDRHRALDESSMSALFIQVKRRQQSGSDNGYIIDQRTLGFFPNEVLTTQQDSRPYVTLVTELGANAPPPDVHIGNNTRTSAHVVSKLPEEHPRYSIRAYGCTNATWKVINAMEHDAYMRTLSTDDLLADHPRQDEASLQLVRRMVPLGFRDTVWLSDELKPTEIVQPSAAVEVGSYDEPMEFNELPEVRAEVEGS